MLPEKVAFEAFMAALNAAVGKLTENLFDIIGKDKKENSQNHNDESNQNDKYKVDLEVVKKLKR